jgi:hypothetical protein
MKRDESLLNLDGFFAIMIMGELGSFARKEVHHETQTSRCIGYVFGGRLIDAL